MKPVYSSTWSQWDVRRSISIKLPLSSPVWPTLIEYLEGESNMRLVDISERGSRGKSCRKARLGGEDTWVLWWLPGKECPWKDGQPYCTLQRPELGNHVRETVLLKIQNSSLYKSQSAWKQGGGRGIKNHPFFPKGRRKASPLSPGRKETEGNQKLNRSSLYEDGTQPWIFCDAECNINTVQNL